MTSTGILPRPKINAALLAIVIIFFISRLTLFFLEYNDFLYRLPRQDDAPSYLGLASIYAGDQTYESLDLSPFTRVPIYPLLLALLTPLSTPFSYALLFVYQQALQLAIILIVYAYIYRYFSRRWAFSAALILLFFYDFTIYGFLVRPEVLFTFFLLLACLLYLAAISSNRLLWFTLAALLVSLSTLTRPVAALFIFPLLLLTIYHGYRVHDSWRPVLARLLFMILAYTLPLLPWFYHNYQLSGLLILQQDTGNLIHTTVPGGHWGTVDIHQIVNTDVMSEWEADRVLTKEALTRIKTNPTIWLKNSFSNFFFRLWSMGFADTYLRYLDHTAINPGGYHTPVSPSIWQRLASSWQLFNPAFNISPIYHLYFILNNFLGLAVTFSPVLSLILFPFLPYPSKIVFIFLLYFWVITACFAFSGSRYMVPLLPLLWLTLPAWPAAFKRLVNSDSKR